MYFEEHIFLYNVFWAAQDRISTSANKDKEVKVDLPMQWTTATID